MSCETINKNLLLGSKFKVIFDRLPDMSFFAKETTIPSISLTQNAVGSPFVDRSVPGDKLEYAGLDITFLVNEDMSPWKEIHDWMRGLGFPTSFEEYRNIPNLSPMAVLASRDYVRPQYSDGSILIYSNKNNPLISYTFRDMFPIALGGMDLSTTATPNDVITVTASFRYTHYDFKHL